MIDLILPGFVFGAGAAAPAPAGGTVIGWVHSRIVDTHDTYTTPDLVTPDPIVEPGNTER